MSKTASIALAALLGSLAACQGKAGPAPTEERSPDAAPPLVATSVKGDIYDIAEHRGEVLLVNMWATWCEPCRKELPEFARLQRELGPQGFRVVAVNVDVRRKEPAVRKMVQELRLPFTVLLDPGNQSVMDWKVVGYPTSFVVGRDGRVLWRRDGMIFEQDEELTGVLSNALAAGGGQ